MDLTSYVDNLRRELAIAAEAGGDDARALAERLSAPLEASARLGLLEALTAAADEITRDLAPGSVEVRLRGRDPEFVVTPPPTDESPVGAAGPPRAGLRSAPAGGTEVALGVRPPAPEADEGGTSRLTLRLPEHLKSHIDEAARQAGLSVNAWLVRVVAAALAPDDRGRRAGGPEGNQFGRRHTGWVR